MTTGTQRRDRVIPDFDDGLGRALGRIAEVLSMLADWELDFSGSLFLPWPIAGRYARDALIRVQGAVAPTQSHDGRPADRGGRFYAPDGCHEHGALRLVLVDHADLELLNETAMLLGHSATVSPECELAEALRICLSATGPWGWTPSPVEAVAEFTRVLGMLDLAETDDTRLLTDLIGAAGDADITLDRESEQAYLRILDRFHAMWVVSGLDRP